MKIMKYDRGIDEYECDIEKMISLHVVQTDCRPPPLHVYEGVRRNGSNRMSNMDHPKTR